MASNSVVGLVLTVLLSPFSLSSAVCGVYAAMSERHLGRRMSQVQLQQPEPGMHSSPPPSSTCRGARGRPRSLLVGAMARPGALGNHIVQASGNIQRRGHEGKAASVLQKHALVVRYMMKFFQRKFRVRSFSRESSRCELSLAGRGPGPAAHQRKFALGSWSSCQPGTPFECPVVGRLHQWLCACSCLMCVVLGGPGDGTARSIWCSITDLLAPSPSDA
jgi:hypothetical protein